MFNNKSRYPTSKQVSPPIDTRSDLPPPPPPFQPSYSFRIVDLVSLSAPNPPPRFGIKMPRELVHLVHPHLSVNLEPNALNLCPTESVCLLLCNGSFPPTERTRIQIQIPNPIVTLYYAQLFPLVQIQIPVRIVSRMVTVPILGIDLRPRDPNPSPLVEMSHNVHSPALLAIKLRPVKVYTRFHSGPA